MLTPQRSSGWISPVLRAGLAVGVLGVAVVTPAHATTPERAAPARLEASLKPSGDANGSGEAHFTLNKARQRVCAHVEWRGIEAPDAAHIHKRSDGSIVVDLVGSVTGGSTCATGVPGALIDKILARPGKYYFNVHNPTYPAGAIEGRLHR